MAAGVKSLSKTFVWIIMGLLVAGLAGFGATNLSGTVRTVGSVGDQVITVDAYARELQREIRSIESQTGQPMQMSQVQLLGIDQAVLARLVALASIDHEVAGLGLSVGDENLQKEILEIAAFQGIDGSFDRESYRFALDRAGLSEIEFEDDLRAEAARTLVQGAIVAGVEMPTTMSQTMTDYIAARRSFTVATLDAAQIETPVPAPNETELVGFYDANAEAFTLPETKQLTYALLTPEMILDQVEIDEASVRQLYDARSSEYDIPERRLVERLVYADDAAAAAAKAQIEVGGSTFEMLVEDRGLTLSDIDLGDVTATDLDSAADAVFAAEIGDVVGPLPSSLGPALFRVNGTLAARVTDFDAAEPELRDELAGERARRLIEAQLENFNDLLAGGATLEELAAETDMELGQTDWSADAFEGIAAYDAFRERASAVTLDDFPEMAFLDDGGIFALRLNDVLPPRPHPFDDARDLVAAAWAQEKTQEALSEKAEGVIADLAVNGDFTETGLPFRVENALTRTAFLDGTPPDFMNQVFEMEEGELRVIAGAGTVLIVRLDKVLPPEENNDLTTLRAAIDEQFGQALAQALFNAFVRDAQSRARPTIDQRAVNAVQASFQ